MSLEQLKSAYAIIEEGGKQFRVVPGETIQIEKMGAKEGHELTPKALWAAGDSTTGSDTKALLKTLAFW